MVGLAASANDPSRPRSRRDGSCDQDAADAWRDLAAQRATRPSPCAGLAERMREQRLTFGGRAALPVPPPVLPRRRRRSAASSRRRKRCGRSASASPRRRSERPELLDELGLSEAEIRLARIDPGYAMASTAARADAFILPDSLQFAEYNAESPAGAGLQPAAGRGVRRRAGDGARSASASTRGYYTPDRRAARRAARQLSRLGRHRRAAADRDRRLARGADVERVRAPARRLRRARRADGDRAIRAIWSFDGSRSVAGGARASTSSTAAS